MTLLIVYILVALAFSFLCSIAEAVLLCVTPGYVQHLQTKRPRTAAWLGALKVNIDRPLAAILTLNTIAHTVGAAGAGAQATKIFGDAALGLASAILTLLILVFSEIIPKILGAVYWRPLAPSVTRFVRLLVWILYPFVLVSAEFTRLFSGRIRKHQVNRDELAALAHLGVQEGQLDPGELHIFKNLLALRSLKAADVMTPRTVVFALPEAMTVDQFFAAHSEVPFSRIPIFRGDRDEMTRFVLKNDLLLAQARDEHERTLNDFARPLPSVESQTIISELLERMLVWRTHLAVVRDDYGGMCGLVSMEDAVETLLGSEIIDEADRESDLQKLARAAWVKRAAELGLPVHEIAAPLERSVWPAPREETRP